MEGLSVGDAFGQCFFGSVSNSEAKLAERILPPATWFYTDDTVMALAILEVLAQKETVDQDRLAQLFADKYQAEPNRGYGGTAHRILRHIGEGMPWQQAASQVFDGMGSIGNGGAMRAAPIGAYFYDDLDEVVRQATLSAEVTHSHLEGQAGAVAVALAAAYVQSRAGHERAASGREMLETAIKHTPESDTRSKLNKALALPFTYSVQTAASVLGNGMKLTSPDTVPFSLWCAARHLDHFEEALWTTVSGLGDRDTTCAIVGSIVILGHTLSAIPGEWLRRREELPLASPISGV